MRLARNAVSCALLLLAACAGPRGASEGQQQALGVLGRIDEVAAALDVARKEIQITVQAHGALIPGRDGKLVVHYAELREGLAGMIEARDEVDGAIAELIADGEEYFADWADGFDDIESGTLREQGRGRHAEARARFDAMATAARRISGLWAPVERIVRDHVAYLSHDLNASSVQSLGEEAQQLRNAVAQLGRAMDDYERRADEFRRLVSPVAASS